MDYFKWNKVLFCINICFFLKNYLDKVVVCNFIFNYVVLFFFVVIDVLLDIE